ncbi:MAG: DNA mismatch repair endonuclease MutL, partial [Puniceicoccaceae bacterium]
MAGKIVKLPDSVANQIAAGEVVERPVAVVKELVENSLDAGARSIEIQFEQGGKALIRVLDDGTGMSPEDAAMALQRHATSKISEVEDILRIASFGFRGEALPSIASVSRFVLRTRQREAAEGTELKVDGGREPVPSACGMSPGTEVIVSHLFHNVPARRKFMKTDRTEAAHILQMCRLLAVAHPEVAFSLIEDGHEVFRTPACPDRLQRVREIFGRRRVEDLLPVEFENDGLVVSGLVGRPGVGRSTRAEMVTFVNKRPVDSRLLNYALIESYHRYLPRGRYPMAFLFVDVPDGEVDVNVHPTKREVRFRAEPRIRSAVMSGLTEFLARQSRQSLRQAETVEPMDKPASPTPPRPSMVPPQPREQLVRRQPTTEVSSFSQTFPKEELPASAPPVKPSPDVWRYCGIFQRRLGLFESPDGLIVVNPVASRERVLFEQMVASLKQESIPSQPMLIPPMLELSPLEATLLGDQIDFFASIGFGIEPFGRHLFRIRSIPAWLQADKAETFVEELVNRIRERGLRPDDKQPALILVARLAAIREARGFSPDDQHGWEGLAKDLLRCENPLLDARGRPTFFELRNSEMNRKLMLQQNRPDSDSLDG